MTLQSITVKNFRSVLEETLSCESLTALVGANGSGKSTFLRALDVFYNNAAKVDRDDFYNRVTGNEIVISLTFANLSNEAKELFDKYIQSDTLTVDRVFRWEEDKVVAKYHGSTLQNPDFKLIKEQLNTTGMSKQAKESYAAKKAETKYSGLPTATTKDAMKEALEAWEDDNPDDGIRERDDGQFFGFQSVGTGYLGKFTKFLFIPAIRDASDDASENKGSPINVLMDLVVRSVLASKEDVKTLREETQSQYASIMAPTNLPELGVLSGILTETLKTYAPDASVDLVWQPLEQVSIPMPQADVLLSEDGYSSPVSKTGHGLQRAFILTLLQHLAKAQASIVSKSQDETEESAEPPKIPNFLIAIEEPELYQHPNRQRHLANILIKLSSGEIPGVADNTQVLYCTHSPLFVGIDRINNIRLLRKVEKETAKPKVTEITSTSLDAIAEQLDTLDGATGTYTAASLSARLQSIMTPIMNEGFFANVIVLVEGENDRSAIMGMAKSLGYDLDASGFAVIPCGGKTSIDRPYLIFKNLGIPVYVVWDGDHGKPNSRKEDNQRLLRLLSTPEEDWPEFVNGNSSCFKRDLETTLKVEVGDTIFDECIEECKVEFGIVKNSQVVKNSNFYYALIEKAKAGSVESATLKSIVENLIALRA